MKRAILFVFAFGVGGCGAAPPSDTECITVILDNGLRRMLPADAERAALEDGRLLHGEVRIRRGKEVRMLDEPAKLAEAKAYGWHLTCRPVTPRDE